MPEGWKEMASAQDALRTASTMSSKQNQKSAPRRASGLTRAEKLLITILTSALIAYGALHWKQITSARSSTNIPVTPVVYLSVFGGLILYAVRRTSFEEEVLRSGVLTTGVLAGWYDKSSYSRSGYNSYIRIRYYFWTESGQKFEGGGTLVSGLFTDSLSINQEPLKIFYLPQDPSKSVALCCTTIRPVSYTSN
jgi:hypothetical protein